MHDVIDCLCPKDMELVMSYKLQLRLHNPLAEVCCPPVHCCGGSSDVEVWPRCRHAPVGAFKNGDVLTVSMDLTNGILRFSRNGIHLGDAFTGLTGPLVAVVTQASEESKVTIQNRPTVLNMGEYTGELR